jgi:adenylosuccinate lyase
LTDYLLFLMTYVVRSLRVNEKRMLQNIDLTQGRLMSEAVMITLSKKGMNRQAAHELLRKLTIRSELEGQSFRQALLESKAITKKLTKKEIDEALNPCNYLGTAGKQVELMVEKTKMERTNRE